MTPYIKDIEHPLLQFGPTDQNLPWTIETSFLGCSITGANGSGKTTGSARAIILKFLRSGYSGLVLTVKPDEKANFEAYCRETGRLDDLVVIEPESKHHFDFLKYLSTNKNLGTSNTDNILETLKTVIAAGEEKSNSRSEDPFWEQSLSLLLSNSLSLISLVYGEISVPRLYEIVLSLPSNPEARIEVTDSKENAFEKAFKKATSIVKAEIDRWYNALSLSQQDQLKDEELFNEAVLTAVPNARTLKYLDLFFFETFKNLSSKTRSIIEFSFTGFLYKLLREPFYSMFCNGKVNIKPEDCFEGKIILLNIPVKSYHAVGRDCQMLVKYIWQMAMEKRNVLIDDRPVFLYADESQHFIHEHDAIFQATARSSRVAVVYITQNLPNYYAVMGGAKSEHRVRSLMGTLGTKIFHANSETLTNIWAAELIGEGLFIDPSSSVTTAEKFSQSESLSLKFDKKVRPEQMIGMKTGGPRNDYIVEAYIHVQGDKLFGNENFKRIRFNQKTNY